MLFIKISVTVFSNLYVGNYIMGHTYNSIYAIFWASVKNHEHNLNVATMKPEQKTDWQFVILIVLSLLLLIYVLASPGV